MNPEPQPLVAPIGALHERSDAPPTFRFAPSPNGLLHLGHAYSALLNDRLAREAGGRLLLRLEDIDLQRCRETFAQAIEEDLTWLGLRWERPVRRQSQHFAAYATALESLRDRGLAYPCFCTRGIILASVANRPNWPKDPDGVPLYPGSCRVLSAGERRRRIASGQPFGWRLDVGPALAIVGAGLDWVDRGGDNGACRRVASEPARWGDAMIARKDVPTSYNLAVVTDDAAQGVTDVVRGADLFAATGLQRLLQALLGLPVPRYHHHRLILDEAGHKLSKSRGARSLRSLRQEGLAAAAVRRSLGFA